MHDLKKVDPHRVWGNSAKVGRTGMDMLKVRAKCRNKKVLPFQLSPLRW